MYSTDCSRLIAINRPTTMVARWMKKSFHVCVDWCGGCTSSIGVESGLRIRRVRAVLVLDFLEDFLTVDRDVLGRLDANAHLVALDPEYGDRHIAADHQCFANASGQDQHTEILGG